MMSLSLLSGRTAIDKFYFYPAPQFIYSGIMKFVTVLWGVVGWWVGGGGGGGSKKNTGLKNLEVKKQ